MSVFLLLVDHLVPKEPKTWSPTVTVTLTHPESLLTSGFNHSVKPMNRLDYLASLIPPGPRAGSRAWKRWRRLVRG